MKLKSIQFETGNGDTLLLDVDQARELYEQLKALFDPPAPLPTWTEPLVGPPTCRPWNSGSPAPDWTYTT